MYVQVVRSPACGLIIANFAAISYTQSPYPKRMYPDHLQAVIHNAGSESSEAGIGSHRSLVWYESPTLAVQYLDHPRLRHFLQ